MPHPEIEYLDGFDPDSALVLSGSGQRIHLTDSRFSKFLTIVGALIVVVAVLVSIGLALAYAPSTGDPLGPPRLYSAASGVPPAADLVIGTLGLVLGLGLISLGRMVANSAAAVSELVAIRSLLTESDQNENDR